MLLPLAISFFKTHECNGSGLEERLAAETAQHQDRHRHRAKISEGLFITCRVPGIYFRGLRHQSLVSWECSGILGCMPGYNRMHTRGHPGILGRILGYPRGYTPSGVFPVSPRVKQCQVPGLYILGCISGYILRFIPGYILRYIPGYTLMHARVCSGAYPGMLGCTQGYPKSTYILEVPCWTPPFKVFDA